MLASYVSKRWYLPIYVTALLVYAAAAQAKVFIAEVRATSRPGGKPIHTISYVVAGLANPASNANNQLVAQAMACSIATVSIRVKVVDNGVDPPGTTVATLFRGDPPQSSWQVPVSGEGSGDQLGPVGRQKR